MHTFLTQVVLYGLHFSCSHWEFALIERSDWLSLSLLVTAAQLMKTSAWRQGAMKWLSSLVSHLASNAWFTYLLLGQRCPRRRQWKSTKRFRVSPCFDMWKKRSHNVLKDNKQHFFLSCFLIGLCSVGVARLGPGWSKQPTKEGY